MQELKSENFFWADLIRVVTVFGVVLVHSAADVITEFGAVPGSWWWAANIYDSLARGCVPVFVMLSGALLLPKSESYLDFFRKRFRRVIIPFVAWVVLYLIWKKHYYAPNLTLFGALKLATADQVTYHLWFLYLIVGLYLITPLLRILVKHASSKDLIYFLFLWYAASSLLPFWDRIDAKFIHSGLRFNIPLEMVQGFIGYFILGYFLGQSQTKRYLPGAYAVWTGTFLTCLSGTYLLSRYAGSYQNLFYDNMAPNVVFYVAAVFLIMKDAGPALEQRLNVRSKTVILSISKASFGIYLIHPMILDALCKGRWGFVLKPNLPHPVYMIPLVAVSVYFLSYLSVLAIQKIPGLRKIV